MAQSLREMCKDILEQSALGLKSNLNTLTLDDEDVWVGWDHYEDQLYRQAPLVAAALTRLLDMIDELKDDANSDPTNPDGRREPYMLYGDDADVVERLEAAIA